MSRARAQIKRMLVILLACLVPTVLLGCAQLFRQAKPEEMPEAVNTAPADRVIIMLDIAMADRPGEDALLSLVWDDVDELGVLEADKKRLLNANGFRVGVAGSSVPSALQTVLRESVARESSEPAWQQNPDQLPGSSQVTLFDGQDTLFEVSGFGELSFIEVDENGEPIGDENSSFANSRCVVRLNAEKMQDGWIKLHFLPEIHHGAKTNRAMVGDDGLQLKSSQRIQPLYKYQFDVTLNPGEIAIVGAADSGAHCPGCQFLTANTPSGPLQKLITVRFVRTANVAGQRQHQQLIHNN